MDRGVRLIFVRFTRIIFFRSFSTSVRFISRARLMRTSGCGASGGSSGEVGDSRRAARRGIEAGIGNCFPAIRCGSIFSCSPCIGLMNTQVGINVYS